MFGTEWGLYQGFSYGGKKIPQPRILPFQYFFMNFGLTLALDEYLYLLE
jgi:hypothetical protein